MNDAAIVASTRFAEVAWRGIRQRIEYEWVGDARSTLPAWSSSCTRASARSRCGRISRSASARRTACAASSSRAPAMARSTPKPTRRALAARLHAAPGDEVLPALLRRRRRSHRPWLFGHSDGALDRTAACGAPSGRRRRRRRHRISSLKTSRSRASREARDRLRDDRSARAPGPLSRRPRFGLSRLERCLAEPGVSQTGISRRDIETIACPVLALQGEDDEYGTLAQVRAVAPSSCRRAVAGAPALRPFTASRPA